LIRKGRQFGAMSIGPILESAGTLLDLFENEPARHIFEEEIGQRVTKAVGLPIASNPGTKVEPVDLQLSRLELRQTLDNAQGRENILKRATNLVKNRLVDRGIAKLGSEGIKFEAGYDVLIVGYHLVGQIWY